MCTDLAVRAGDDITVLLRVPRGSAVEAVVLRYLRDSEPKAAARNRGPNDGDGRLVARDVPGLEPGDAV